MPSPNSPDVLFPQANNTPLVLIAAVLRKPAVTAIQLLPPTCTGLDLLTMVPSPNCPTLLLPQANNVPSALIATECPILAPGDPPAATAVQLLVPICTGLLLLTVVPSPNSPEVLRPQLNNKPSERIAKL